MHLAKATMRFTNVFKHWSSCGFAEGSAMGGSASAKHWLTFLLFREASGKADRHTRQPARLKVRILEAA